MLTKHVIKDKAILLRTKKKTYCWCLNLTSLFSLSCQQGDEFTYMENPISPVIKEKDEYYDRETEYK